MKCNNCRCIIPNASERCMYCGHAVTKFSVRDLGSEKDIRTSWDFTVINDDGTIDVLKMMIYFSGAVVITVVILLLLLLLTI